jgi:hypothetical protein
MASERELILAKREGFVEACRRVGNIYLSTEQLNELARRAFPLPKVTRLRTISWWSGAGSRSRTYRFDDGKFMYRDAINQEWRTSTWNAKDIGMLYDLMTNPMEEVDGE